MPDGAVGGIMIKERDINDHVSIYHARRSINEDVFRGEETRTADAIGDFPEVPWTLRCCDG